MATVERGYRPWNGTPRSSFTRGWVIARAGLERQFRKRLFRYALIAGWAPVLFYGAAFFAVGWLTANHAETAPGRPGFAEQFLFGVVGSALGRLVGDPALHGGLWSILFHTFFTTSQLIAAFVMITITAPSLIADDLRGRTFLLLFSRPLARWDYLAGKLAIPLAAALSVTLAPALALYGLSLALVPSGNLFAATRHVVPDAVCASLAIALPASLLALFLSSLTREGRYVLFAWLAIWLGGLLAADVVDSGSRRLDASVHKPWLGTLLSIQGSVRAAVDRCFDLPGTLERTGFFRKISETVPLPAARQALSGDREPAGPPVAVLAGLSLLCAAGLWVRIRERGTP